MKSNLEVTTRSANNYSVSIRQNWPEKDALPASDKILVAIDQNVNDYYGAELHSLFASSADEVLWHVVPSGEASKSMKEFNRIIDYALSNKIRRTTPLWAIGGGVTGDLAGFAAASLLRGVPLYHMPTTLLAMVDSAIGGKTGVNHKAGKNLIGAFYQPRQVWMNVSVLSTLPAREWNCGLAEILKYGCIAEYDLLEKSQRLIGGDDPQYHQELPEIIEESARIKIDIVNQDEKEAGVRSYLNFGHTFGHALEAFTGYSRFVHGEAVFIGLVAALWASREMGYPVNPDPLLSFVSRYNLSTLDLRSSVEDIVSLMDSDKKNLGKEIRIIVLKDWGKPGIIEIRDRELLQSAMDYALQAVHNSA